MEIVIRHKAQQPCPLFIIFPNPQDAVNHLAMFIDKFGDENYKARFLLDDKMKFTLIPEVGGKGISFSELTYSREEFSTFRDSYVNREVFFVFFAYRDGKDIAIVPYNKARFLNVRGYSLDEQ